MQSNRNYKISRGTNGRYGSRKKDLYHSDDASDEHDSTKYTSTDYLVVDVTCPEAMTDIASVDHCTCQIGSVDHCTCHTYNCSVGSSFGTSSEYSSHDDHVSESFIFSDVNEEIHPCQDIIHGNSCASKVDELQLDLRESALEYELKVLEMKMKMVKTPPENDEYSYRRLTEGQGSQLSSLEQVPTVTEQSEKQLTKRLDTCTKKMNQLQAQRDFLANELSNFKNHQKRYELRKECMNGLIRRVNNLQKKLQIKEEEMIECQLKEKEAKARLHELVAAVERSKAKFCEPKQLVKLIPSIRSWLRSLRKSEPIKGNPRELMQLEQFEVVLGRILESVPQELLKQGQKFRNQSAVNNHKQRMENHDTPVDCIKEVYALQQELERLATSRGSSR